jgi:hypothetical protein
LVHRGEYPGPAARSTMRVACAGSRR